MSDVTQPNSPEAAESVGESSQSREDAAAQVTAQPEVAADSAGQPEVTEGTLVEQGPAVEPAPAAIERGAGRADASGTVHVREGDVWRQVGQFPDATPDEALQYFERKYADLEGQVRLLEQRMRGGANPKDVAKAASHLAPQVEGANAVGDLAALATRIDALRGDLKELEAKKQAETRAEIDASIAERTQIVESIEKLSAGDLANIQWKQTMQRVDALFSDWQKLQKDGPRVPKGQADALWKRFRDARSTLESARRHFFAELDAAHKTVRAKKQVLIDQAVALRPKGADGIPAYRALLDQWKAAGRAGKKADDALWSEFKEAGDALFDAKAKQAAAEDEEYNANLAAKRALLEEASPILGLTDRKAARSALADIQSQWEEIGKVPRDQVRDVEDRMRAIETHVRDLDDQHWKSTNPERKARSEGMLGQLEEAIEKLEAQIASTSDAKQKRELEAELSTKRSWLEVVAAAG